MIKTTETTVARTEALRLVASLFDKRDYAGVVRYVEVHHSEIEHRADTEAGVLMRFAAAAYSSLADLTAALKAARTAQHYLTANGDTAELAEIFFVLGGILKKSDNLKESEQAFRDAESIFRRLDLLDGQARALNGLAGIYFKQGNLKNALNVLADALEIAHKLQNPRMIAMMTGNIGRIHLFSGNLSAAKNNLRTNIDLSKALRDDTETARALLSLAYTSMQLGEFAEAEATLAEALMPLRRSGDRRDEAMYYSYLGELKRRIGQLQESKQMLAHALRLSEQLGGDSGMVGRVARQVAETALALGEYRIARQSAFRAINILESIGMQNDLSACYRIVAMVSETEGERKVAANHWDKALELAGRVNVKFEKAETQYYAGLSSAIPANRRLLLLIRADEYYSQTGNQVMVDRIGDAIEQTNPPRIAFKGQKDTKGSNVDFPSRCAAIEKVKEQIVLIGMRSNLPILLTGETGVGKDRMARYYHSRVRPGTPFVAINCAGVPETLLESELFGFRRGAFTDAHADKVGHFVAANGGVLFLDEIGDMPLHLQAKLLGVLERREVTPLGSTTAIQLDVNLICATNKDLHALVESGHFRRDLYFRICDGDIHHIPALRDRKEDIPLLLELFIKEGPLGEEGYKVTPELVQAFLTHDWPGNVRELHNKVKRLAAQAEELGKGDLAELAWPMFTDTTAVERTTFFDRIEQFERELLRNALLAANGNKSEAARILGIHEATVRAKMKRFQIEVNGIPVN